MKLFHLALCACLLSACSSASPSATDDDGGASTPDARGGPDAPRDAPAEARADGGAACNALANAAPVVTVTQVASDPPAAEGGAINGGNYPMTEVRIYTGAGGPAGATGTAQTTIVVSGDGIDVVSAGDPPTRTVSLATEGTTFTATDTCPDTSVTHGSYTATATTFLIFLDGGTDDAGARTVVETFTKL